LVHDDVVDDANYRRGFFSINALWKNKIAVLVGDYLLSRGLLLSVEHNDFHLLRIVSNAVKEMSEGELLQSYKARKLDLDEDVYYQIIRQKTASLIASCCSVGASSVSTDEGAIQKMWNFGEKVGMAFQIKDDLFDYGEDEIGKPVGIDIKEKKMTLPLIYALQQSNRSEKRRIINIIKNKNDEPNQVQMVIDFVRQSGGLAYAETQMKRYQQEAFDLIANRGSAAHRNHLENLVLYTTQRTN
jgi:octaprenyl-diphosphate synthase